MAVVDGISIGMIGLMFYLFHVADTIETRNKDDAILPLNSMIAIILYVMSGFTAFMLSQYIVAVGIENTVGDQVLASLRGMHSFITNGSLIFLVIVLLKLLLESYNLIIELIDWVIQR